MPFALQNRALFEGEKRVKKVPRQGEEDGVASKGAKKEKRTHENKSAEVGADFWEGDPRSTFQ